MVFLILLDERTIFLTHGRCTSNYKKVKKPCSTMLGNKFIALIQFWFIELIFQSFLLTLWNLWFVKTFSPISQQNRKGWIVRNYEVRNGWWQRSIKPKLKFISNKLSFTWSIKVGSKIISNYRNLNFEHYTPTLFKGNHCTKVITKPVTS